MITTNFRRMLMIMCSGAAQLLKNQSATETSTSRNSTMFTCQTVDSDHDKGVIAGTGTTAEAVDDFQLATKINHGVGAGQLQYGSSTVALVSINGKSVLEFSKPFTNNSGNAITINEVGLLLSSTGSSAALQYLCVRIVLTTPITISNGAAKTVVIRLPVECP